MFSLAVKYVIFAVLATISNIVAQDLVFRAIELKYELYIGIMVGTLVGLVVKYLLDKKYIFSVVTQNLGQDMQKFILYSIMGVVTTLIFWGFELSFHYIFHSENAKYVGAVIGLSIGYITKYQLDKRFVFPESVLAQPKVNNDVPRSSETA